MMNNRKKGSCYEEMAASFLIRKGYVLLEKNYRKKTGEIDLIMKETPERIVFVEVKYRGSTDKGYPFEAVTPNKMARIYRTAQWYLMEHHLSENIPCRFDVVSILGDEITHIENAFGGL